MAIQRTNFLCRCKSKALVNKMTAGTKKRGQEATNYLAELITQQRKNHALGEDVTMPAYKITRYSTKS